MFPSLMDAVALMFPLIKSVSLTSVTNSASMVRGGPYIPAPTVGISLTIGGGKVLVVSPT